MITHSSAAPTPPDSKMSLLNQVKEMPDQARNRKRSWNNVCLVVGTFLAGVVLAIGHDRFNNHLSGQRVDDFTLSQNWVSRVSTAFAFLVKMCLTATAATSYFQRLWRNLKTRPFEVEKVDTLVAAPTAALSFLSPGAWLRVPGLLIMGLMIWCLPLAAVITPGTLIVVPAPITNTTLLQVPQLSYNASTWADVGPLSSNREFWSASSDVQKAGFAAAVTGQVVGASHTYANETYTLDFHAPAIQCSPANNSVQATAKEYYRGLSGSGGHSVYNSWVGGDVGIMADANSTGSSRSDEVSHTLDMVSVDAARIFIFSQMNQSSSLDNLVTECLLHNATYSVAFAVQNGLPSTVVSQLTINEKIPAMHHLSDSDGRTSDIRFGPQVSDNGTHYSYQAVMDVFGKLLVGAAVGQGSSTNVYDSSFQRMSVNWYDRTQIQVDLETLFQNITLSLFSNSKLLLNSTQASYVPVTVTVFRLTYQYQPEVLWAAYGAAVVATLAAALVGLQSMYASGASYSSRFSTSVRIARTTGLDRLLDDEDDGSDPLPREIGAARMQVISSGRRAPLQEAN